MTSLTPAAAYRQWLDYPQLTPDLRADLKQINGNEEEIASRFSGPMAFGTAGLRSKMGAGIARMNIYTVAQTTQALGTLVLRENGEKNGVVIAYDSRNNSSFFAEIAARVLANMGIRVYFFESLRPTPELSFAILHHHCIAGINITASHNPKEYNGYKVYWSDGAQLPPDHAAIVSAETEKIGIFEPVLADFAKAVSKGLITIIGKDTDDAFLNAVLACRIDPSLLSEYGDSLNLVYTPLHGTGYKLVPEALRRAGIHNLRLVEEQAIPDGNFPTVASPNPENKPCFEMAFKLIARKKLPTDVIIASDPDGDRLGVAVLTDQGEFTALSGNQIGALLVDYIISSRKATGTLPSNACAIRSVVSSRLFDAICRKNGVLPMCVLTGFKYIGEKIQEFSETGAHTFIFGYEESQGFLSAGYARDKDAVAASLLIAEAACYHKKHGRSLYQALCDIYQTYGYYNESILTVSVTGAVPMDEMKKKMALLRQEGVREIGGLKVIRTGDYLSGFFKAVGAADEPTGLPASDMLRYELEDGSVVIVRPSGTEPKIKMYLQAVGDSMSAVAEKLEHLKTVAQII